MYAVFVPSTLAGCQAIWPRPEVFNPDNFASTPKPFTFLPFHGGPRLCLGMDMAYMETKVALVHLLRRYKFKVHDGFTLQLKTKVMLTARNGIQMDISRRA
jgi:cytochrome P450